MLVRQNYEELQDRFLKTDEGYFRWDIYYDLVKEREDEKFENF
jgi:hypothetical protein